MKFLSLLSIVLIAISQSYGQTSSIILSSIGPQEVYEEARITVYFSTLKHFDTIGFSSDNMPAFATLLNDGEGSGRFIFDPTTADVGDYFITLSVVSGAFSTQSTFNLSVKALPEDANVYYVDPINGHIDNPGSAEAPFPGLASVFFNNLASINENTFFYLRTGYHGKPTFQGAHDEAVHVLAARTHTPTVSKINFFLTINWYVSGLDISPANNNESNTATLVNISAGSKKIVLTNCKIYSIEDASVWTSNEDWYEGCADGIISAGKKCLYKNNYLKNTWFSVELRQEESEFSYNIINWFGGDAVRALDNDQKVLYNQIKNATVFDYAHPTRPQHDDGIQSWTFNQPVKNMRIIGNQIADISDPNLPLPTEIMQGIVDFDGFAEDWIVENNLVITHHPHGIALYGAKNCKVTNNTVIRNPLNYYSSNTKPWIRINPRKEEVGGDLSTGNLVRNNIMSTYQDEDKEPATLDNNILGNNYTSYFENYNEWNFYLSASSPAVNAGNEEDAPSIDLHQKRRNIGLVDAGCFEREATLEDRESPTIPTNITLVQLNETSLNLEWTNSEDNTEVAYYVVKVDQQQLKTSSPSIFITKLSANTTYDIEIQAIDFFGNLSESSIYTTTTMPLEMLAVHYVAADRHDQLIKSNDKLMWVGMPFHRIGGYFGEEDASAVFPFELPCIGGREIVSADFITHLDGIVNMPIAGVDLYGLGYNSIACVSNTYHWQGDFGEDANVTPITAAYLTPQSANGTVILASEKHVILGQYLQGIYNEGAECGDFTFLRLNIGAEQAQDNAYYKINAAEDKNSTQVPLLRIISNSPDGVEVVEIKNGLTISPNPNDGQHLNLQISSFDSEAVRILIHNAGGQQVFRDNFLVTTNNISLDVATNLQAGIYFVTILGQYKYAVSQLIIVK